MIKIEIGLIKRKGLIDTNRREKKKSMGLLNENIS